MKFRRRKRRTAASFFDMTPLIDVVLLVLIFFMIASTFMVQSNVSTAEASPEPSEPSESPQPIPTPAPSDSLPANIIVSIKADGGDTDARGTIQVDGLTVEKDRLQSVLEIRRAERATEPKVLIRADGDVPAQRIVDVMEACEKAGLQDFGIGVAPADAAP